MVLQLEVITLLIRYCAVLAFLAFFLGCNRNEKVFESTTIGSVASVEQVTSIRDNAGNGLIAFDFYASWCGPCRSLSPVLEMIARENTSRIAFYRVNIDNVPQAAQLFKVDRIPFVVFVKHKEVVAELTGIQPRAKYLDIIAAYSAKPPSKDSAVAGTF
jgi:thioredoxin 1